MKKLSLEVGRESCCIVFEDADVATIAAGNRQSQRYRVWFFRKRVDPRRRASLSNCARVAQRHGVDQRSQQALCRSGNGRLPAEPSGPPARLRRARRLHGNQAHLHAGRLAGFNSARASSKSERAVAPCAGADEGLLPLRYRAPDGQFVRAHRAEMACAR
jgi:hypothetical protein